MIKDLCLVNEDLVQASAQVCIIGAGTAGIFLAQELRQHGVSVVMLEAGGRVACSPQDMGETCEQQGIRYRGADLGRSFGLGGTSVLWGGQMLPLTPADIQARPTSGLAAWPINYSEIAAYFPKVCKALGLEAVEGKDDTVAREVIEKRFPALQNFGDNFDLRLSTWIPFKKRNFAKGFAKNLNADANLTVWLNATVVEMVRTASPASTSLEYVSAQSINRKKLNVRADFVVVCAGALESTRLLMLYDEASFQSITRSGAPLGRYFCDHLSISCGRFICRDWKRFNHAVGAIFQQGLMRTPRLELSAQAQKEHSMTSAFAHFSIVTHGNTGFDIVRDILRHQQGKEKSLKVSPTFLGRVVIDIVSMLYWRLFHQRLRIPPRRADVLLQVDIEQTPSPDSRLLLSEERDQFNRKRLIVNWSITPDDIRIIRKMAELTTENWQKSPLRKLAELQLTLPEKFDHFEKQYDVYHPTGSLRMGNSPTDSVVNRDLRLWMTDNCYVSTTAIFPSAGSANPGMMHLALTMRLAEHIQQRLKSQSP